MVVSGLGMMLQMASGNTVQQTTVNDERRGRVTSFYAMAIMGTAPFGSLLAGGAAKYFGAPTTLCLGGVACILGGVI